MFKTAIFSPGSKDQAAQFKVSPEIGMKRTFFSPPLYHLHHNARCWRGTTLQNNAVPRAMLMCPFLRLETSQGFPPLPVSCH